MTENKQDKASTSDNVQYVNPFGVDYCDYWALLCSEADRANELANSKLDAMVALMRGEQNGTVIHVKLPYSVVDVMFSCGHSEVHGGNLADPTGQYALQRFHRTDTGLCYTCQHPIWPISPSQPNHTPAQPISEHDAHKSTESEF